MTKKLNKKGTSLVELIAVIVIMGIIAGIAIPTTIAVINRQKKNAAAKSVDAIISVLKQRCVEEATWVNPIATAGSSITYGTGTDAVLGMTIQDGTGTATTEALGVDNAEINAGTIKVSYVVASGKYTYTADGLAVSGYLITVDANSGKVSVGNAWSAA